MPIYFKPFSVELPFCLETIGNHWEQEAVNRKKGLSHYHWLQTESGCGTVRIGSLERTLKMGEGFFISPAVPHAYSANGSKWITSFATFDGFLKNDIGKIVGNTPYQFTDTKESAYFSDWINRMILGFTDLSMSSAASSVECYHFLLHFSPVYKLDALQYHPLYVQYIEPVIKEIETNYREQLTVRYLSSCVYITPQYLSRLFQRFMGYSVYTYLTRYRINKAKELIIFNPHTDIQYIGNRVGYNDTSNFISVFKRVTGHTPLEFRRMYG